ncbi:protein ORD [Ceratitis capitata]|uniref:protein ORD n=1 Tax=Ceratitis capitata TaxID=7213 RepID=UPI00061881A8|nr:protein ORD [Ceratitis capitata]
MFIEELEISKILDCGHVCLHFKESRNAVYIVQGNNNCPLRHAMSTALKFICSGRYASIESLTHFKNLHKGYVRVVLLISKDDLATTGVTMVRTNFESGSDSDEPCTSQRALEREQRHKHHRLQAQTYHRLEALRDFRSNPELIEYGIDGGAKEKISIYGFQGKFRTNIDYILHQPFITSNDFKGKWLKFMATKMNGVKHQEQTMSPLFVQFVQLFLKNHYNTCDLLPKLTNCCIAGQSALDVMLATHALKIFNDMRVTFEYISCMEYTVWFLIPHKGRYVSIQEVCVENFKFKDISTYIKSKTHGGTQSKEYIWSNAEHAVLDLLFIAFQLVMCYHFKRGIVYLQEELNNIKDYQTMQFVITAYMHSNGNSNNVPPQKNYLQRILEACNKMQITAIIDYPGGLPVKPVNVNLIKCFKDEDTGGWYMKIVDNDSSCSFNQFKSELEAGLKRH